MIAQASALDAALQAPTVADPFLGASLDFKLPPELEAHAPPEARGLERDGVKLLVSYVTTDRFVHSRFRDLGNFLDPGDLLVVNSSGTLRAALCATREDGTMLELHLSTRVLENHWVVELRAIGPRGTEPFFGARPGESLSLPGRGTAILEYPYPRERAPEQPNRLWMAALTLPDPPEDYLERYGFPIRYGYVPQPWSIEYYQSVFSTEVGSAEMPSAGRPFTAGLVAHLMVSGVQIAPLVLHTGVASLEKGEPPYPEYFRVPAETARSINAARGRGHRVIAVGTTVVRALETATDVEGVTQEGEGWTGLVVTPRRGVRSISGLLTGFHEPRATHLAMLQALAGRDHLRLAYDEALRGGYLWHEFGDSHLILLR